MSQYFKSSDTPIELPKSEVEVLALAFRDMRASGSWDKATMDRVIEIAEMATQSDTPQRDTAAGGEK